MIAPSDTVVASLIITAVAELLVVVSAPVRVMGPSLPSTRIVPLPASTVTPVLKTRPEELPLKVMEPEEVVTPCPIVRPPLAPRVMAPEEVVIPCPIVRLPPANKDIVPEVVVSVPVVESALPRD